MQVREPPRGYSPEPTKIILVLALRNVPMVEEFFLGIGIKIVIGTWYLGVFVRDRAAEKIWLAEKDEVWTESVRTLSRVSQKHPYSAYDRLQKSLQQEWEFVQRVTPGIGDAFGLVE